ncbi:hypothetical protein RLIN73S_03297 [Rhodanobacter lindaniclasticus]
MTPSPTPALLRPSSSTRMRLALFACAAMKASLSGASQRRSTTRTFHFNSASIVRAARSAIGTPLPKVNTTRSFAASW